MQQHVLFSLWPYLLNVLDGISKLLQRRPECRGQRDSLRASYPCQFNKTDHWYFIYSKPEEAEKSPTHSQPKRNKHGSSLARKGKPTVCGLPLSGRHLILASRSMLGLWRQLRHPAFRNLHLVHPYSRSLSPPTPWTSCW